MKKSATVLLFLAIAMSLSACGGISDPKASDTIQQLESIKDRVSDQVKDKLGDSLSFIPGIKDEMEDWTPDFDTEILFYYNTLKEEQQKAYLRIVHGIEEAREEIQMKEDITTSDELAIMKAIASDLPQLFWITGSSSYSYDATSRKVLSVSPEYNSLAESLEMNKGAFETAQVPFLKELEGKTDVEKERIIHDRLAQNIEYVSESEENQTAYSAIVYGKTVCAGYTRAFQYLMNQAGIPCYWCQGESLDPAKAEREGEDAKWEPHSWNKVMLDGQCYIVDLTWDDTQYSDEGLISYNYFNVTDDAVKESHKADLEGLYLPICNSTDCSFENLYGHPASFELLDQMGIMNYLLPESLQDYYDMCKDAYTKAGKGEHTITFVIRDPKLLEEIDNSFNKKGYEKGFMNAVVKNLKMKGYRYSIGYEYTTWAEDLTVLKQTLELSSN